MKITAKEPKHFFQQLIGLIGRKKPQALLLRTRFGIHTFGVRFPIDVVILDQNYRVVAIKKSLTPNSIFLWNPKYNNVLELPLGTIAEKNITIGESVTLC